MKNYQKLNFFENFYGILDPPYRSPPPTCWPNISHISPPLVNLDSSHRKNSVGTTDIVYYL